MSQPKPKIYAFVNTICSMGHIGAAIAEDGTVLPASHASSDAYWAQRDMGADGHCTWKHDVYGAHYPDGFEVEWVGDVRAHAALSAIIAKLNAEAPSSEKAA